MGLEGLKATNELVKIAQSALNKSANDCKSEFILRDEIYRVALSDANVDQLRQTANELPDLCEWIDLSDLPSPLTESAESGSVLGALRLHNGCKVIHVPTYLQHLWMETRELADSKGGTATWKLVDGKDEHVEGAIRQLPAKYDLTGFDAVVWAAGSGLFTTDWSGRLTLSKSVQLVRGQSVEMECPSVDPPLPALLCGKYILPMPSSSQSSLSSTTDCFMIGATHEFKDHALPTDQVEAELRESTQAMAPSVWNKGRVLRHTLGYRVQSRRGKFGRLPIIGRLDTDSVASDSGLFHPSMWVFTGLSSRGLLYHALFGDILSDAIIDNDESHMHSMYPMMAWWK
jgi:glycine/D-amino acid oxidase-like deaminating enzyme